MMDRYTPRRCATALAMIAGLTLSGLAGAAPRTWVIDPEHFSISFSIDHAGYAEVIGLFREAGGRFVYDPETQALKSGRVTVQAKSVFTDHEKRDDHVRNADFLDASDHPEITFVADEYESTGENRGRLHGELTLLGKTRPVTLDVRINKMAEYPFGGGVLSDPPFVMGVSASTTLRRSEWGMTYGLDGNLVGDRVDLRFEFEARRQEEE
jgi:polyisoprenoid-binding protein YceI